MIRVWNPALAADPEAGDGYAEIDDSALPAHRQAGWLLASERDDHEAAIEAHRARAEEAAKPARGKAASADDKKTEG